MTFSCSSPSLDQKYRIGFSQCTAGDSWRLAMHEDMERELSFHQNLELIIQDAHGDSQEQLKDIDSLLDSGIDLLIVSPNEADPITPAVEKAYLAEIPVIIVDRRTTSKLYTAYVGADNYELGKAAGHYAAQLLGGEGKIIEIWGLRGSSPAINRSEGFKDALKKYPSVQIIAEVNGEWEQEPVEKKLGSVLKTKEDVNLIFSHNDRMALGAYRVCQKYGLEGKVKQIGVDGLGGPNGGIQYVANGVLDATLLYPTGGEEAIRIASRILEGEPFEKENILYTTVIDSFNVRVMKGQSEKIRQQQEDIKRQRQKILEQGYIYKNQRTALYIVLALLIIAIILGALALLSLRAKQEINRSLEEKNYEILDQRNQIMGMAEQTREATQAKLRFFTNISHEFRTPLTLILGPVEEMLLNLKGSSRRMKKDLTLIRKNAIRLLRLVDQLMDFRKIENHKMKLKASENNLVSFVREIKIAFDAVAVRRQIDYQFESQYPELLVWFDANMLDKVLFNLLSNAFKFTRDHGKIHIRILGNEKEVSLYVEDNGRGMSPEHVEHAFDRFYQGEHYKTKGTGLGLSLSKELIELHHGKISVVSQKGSGTTFRIDLPLGDSHLTPEEKRESSIIDSFSFDHYRVLLEDSDEQEEVLPKDTEKENCILVIEDHQELRNFLIQLLGSGYRILPAGNAEDGLQLSYSEIPDLIICDIMLPGENGYSVVQKVKSDRRTSHIPVILLTANATLDQQIEGLQYGADAYISKPFSSQYLLENIKSLLRNRELLRDYYGQSKTTQILTETRLSKLDQDFVSHFEQLIIQNLDNSDFGVKELCEELGMSRVQVYRKVKALMGWTVSDYIKDVRLSKSRELLLENELTIAEVAYQVGFTSPAYFSTAFKGRYDISPSDYKAEHSRNSG